MVPEPHTDDILRLVALVHDDAPDGVICVDRGFRVRYANRQAEHHFGTALGELMERACHMSAGHAEPCPGCRAAEALATGENLHRTKHGTSADGHESWVEQCWYPVAGGLVLEVERNVTALVTAEREIEQRIRAEDRLRHERNRAKNYLDIAAAIMLTMDHEGRVTIINRRGCEVLGRPEAQIVGRDWFAEFLPAGERDRVRTMFRRFLEGDGRDGDFMNAVRRADGAQRTIEWRNVLVRDDAGVVTGMLSSGMDVTERRAAEEELRFKSFVLDHSIDSIVVHRLDGSVIYANDRAASTRGCTQDEFLKLPPYGWIGPERAGQRAPLWQGGRAAGPGHVRVGDHAA